MWPQSKSSPALHTASESGMAFAGPAGPSMPLIVIGCVTKVRDMDLASMLLYSIVQMVEYDMK